MLTLILQLLLPSVFGRPSKLNLYVLKGCGALILLLVAYAGLQTMKPEIKSPIDGSWTMVKGMCGADAPALIKIRNGLIEFAYTDRLVKRRLFLSFQSAERTRGGVALATERLTNEFSRVTFWSSEPKRAYFKANRALDEITLKSVEGVQLQAIDPSMRMTMHRCPIDAGRA